MQHPTPTPPRPVVRCGIVVPFAALVLTLVPSLLAASSIDVLSAAANTGTYGSRLTLVGCSESENEAVTSPLNGGTVTACDTITASAEVSGTVTFTAGDLIVMEHGFSVADGSSFTAEIDSTLGGDAYLQDNSPEAETTYAVRYYLNPSSMDLGVADRFDQFRAYNAAGQLQFQIAVKENSGENRIFVEARDGSTFASTEGGNELVLPATDWHAVEVVWSAGTGSLEVCVDADAARSTGFCEPLTFSNGTGQIDYVQWGAIGVDGTTTGSIDMDDFDSRRAGPIGTLP